MHGPVFTRASFLSPLPALGPGGPRGLELRHRVTAEAVTGRALRGSADIRLSADRRFLRVRFDLVAPRPGRGGSGAHLYLTLPAEAPAGEVGCAQFIVAIDHGPDAIFGRLSIDARFDAADVNRETGTSSLEGPNEVRAIDATCFVDGISWLPGADSPAASVGRRPSRMSAHFSPIDAAGGPLPRWPHARGQAKRGPAGEREYLRRRLLDETRAALQARSVAATAIHAALATHYAKGLIAASGSGAADAA